jgi:hypothetical protein
MVVNVEKVDQFIETCPAPSPVQGPRASTWIACYDRPADHVLIPCGHFCLCSECVQHVGGRCPLCGIPIEGKQRAYRKHPNANNALLIVTLFKPKSPASFNVMSY